MLQKKHNKYLTLIVFFWRILEHMMVVGYFLVYYVILVSRIIVTLKIVLVFGVYFTAEAEIIFSFWNAGRIGKIVFNLKWKSFLESIKCGYYENNIGCVTSQPPVSSSAFSSFSFSLLFPKLGRSEFLLSTDDVIGLCWRNEAVRGKRSRRCHSVSKQGE